MTLLERGVSQMGKILDKLRQHCTSCQDFVFAKRITGKYVRTRTRILIWECPHCNNLWQDPRRLKDIGDLDGGNKVR